MGVIFQVAFLLLLPVLDPVAPGTSPVCWGGVAGGVCPFEPSFEREIHLLWARQAREGAVLLFEWAEADEPGLGLFRSRKGWVLRGAFTPQETREALAYLAAGGADLFWQPCASCREGEDPWLARALWWERALASRLQGGPGG